MSLVKDEQPLLSSDAQEYLGRKRTSFLREHFKTAIFVSVLNSLLIWGIFRFQAGAEGISYWLGLSIFVNGLRGYFMLSLPANCSRLPSMHCYGLLVAMILAGILCAYPVFLLPDGSSPIFSHLNVLLVAGMTAAASHSYSTHPRYVIAFVLPALVVLITYYFQTNALLASFMSAFLSIYILGMLRITQSVSKSVQLAIINEWKAEQRQAELIESQKILHQHVLAKEKSEAEQVNQIEKIRRFNNALDRLYRHHSFHQSSRDLLFSDCLTTVSEILGVERVSIWCFTDERDAIRCQKLYLRSEGEHLSSDTVLKEADFPAYFSCLRENRVIVAAHAETDPQTAEFCESYFQPNGIKSLLDAPIQSHDGVSGVICCESVGEIRNWQADEIEFLASIGQLISIRVFTDRTETLNTELKKALKTAQEADRAKTNFMATMNHELRTPMNGVLGAATILDQADLEEEQSRLTTAILQSGGVMMALLNDMLDFSKFEAGRIDLEHIAFDPARLLREVSETHYYVASEKGLTLDRHFSGAAEVQLMGDPHRLSQILHNLISNAVKFTQNGKVFIEAAYTEDQGLTIKVTDSGIGIAADRLEHIFKPFFQADSSTTRQFGGTGLGLAIVEKLVAAMDGSVAIQSELGVGTSIEIHLPLTLAEAHSCPRTINSAVLKNTDTPLNGSTFLIADDNPTNLLVLTAFLKKAGAKTVTAANGQEALELFSTTPFDAVLMDIHMPIMDGVEAMKNIREDAPNLTTPIIAVTADAMPEQVRSYLELGFDSHIPKPVRPADVIEMLSSMISRTDKDASDVA